MARLGGVVVAGRPVGQVSVGERSFGWLERYRRLARDWEAASWSVCALIQIAAANLMARRIARYRALYQVG